MHVDHHILVTFIPQLTVNNCFTATALDMVSWNFVNVESDLIAGHNEAPESKLV